ncbi:MAG: hypothetical protein IKL10_04630 [Clostridia bacterium]|nr:hypothetical protein [Clostridia bacterium]
MNLTPEDKEYMNEVFMPRKDCDECRQSVRDELAKGSTNFSLIQKDIADIKNTLQQKKKFNATTISSIIQAVCTVLVVYIAAKLGIQ